MEWAGGASEEENIWMGWEEKGKEAAGGGWDEIRMGTGRGEEVRQRVVKTLCQVGGV